MVPMAANQMPLQFAEPVQYIDVVEEDASDHSVAYAASFAVCALAVAGVAMHKPSARANRRMRVAAPVMQLREEVGSIALGAAPASAGAMARKGNVETDSSILVQGGSLRTWSYRSPAVAQVQWLGRERSRRTPLSS